MSNSRIKAIAIHELFRELFQESKMLEANQNVLGESLEACCHQPRTGFYRDGYCRTGQFDSGRHVVCAQVTAEFLAFTRAQGNDLSTPRPEYDFPGLRPGDRWCLCALRWQEARAAGVAPPIILASTNAQALEFVSLDILKAYAHHP